MGKLREGSVITTENFGDIVITKYLDKDNIHIRFINTGYNLITQSLNIRQGTIKDRLAPAVFGVGVLSDKTDESVLNCFVVFHTEEGVITDWFNEDELELAGDTL